jgi:hypothetical protein
MSKERHEPSTAAITTRNMAVSVAVVILRSLSKQAQERLLETVRTGYIFLFPSNGRPSEPALQNAS